MCNGRCIHPSAGGSVRMRIVFGAAWLTGLLLIPETALSQGRQITGTITGAVGAQPIAGVVVTVIGGTARARTGDDGRYTIQVPDGDVRLVFRSVGFIRREVPVPARQSTLDVTMNEDVFEMEAVVVTGQATTVERRNATTAVSYVSGDEITRVATPTVESALAGKVAGVNLQSNSGARGRDSDADPRQHDDLGRVRPPVRGRRGHLLQRADLRRAGGDRRRGVRHSRRRPGEPRGRRQPR